MPARPRPGSRRTPNGLLLPSRRQFLVGTAAATLLAACGDDGGGDRDEQLSVLRFHGGFYLAGAPARVPFGIADVEGLLPAESAPRDVSVTVKAPDGTTVAEDLTAPFRSEGLPRGYYAFEFTPEEPGFFDYSVATGDAVLPSQVQVAPADDAVLSELVGPGDEMPPIETPTVDDPRGVNPICTREPACDLHDRTVAEVVGTAPLVLMVATPAFCQTAICGPVLDIMLERVADFPEVTFLHVEPFADPSSGELEPSPAATALGLPFEPVLYTVGTDGVVQDRLDYIFDGTEISETVERLVG